MKPISTMYHKLQYCKFVLVICQSVMHLCLMINNFFLHKSMNQNIVGYVTRLNILSSNNVKDVKETKDVVEIVLKGFLKFCRI